MTMKCSAVFVLLALATTCASATDAKSKVTPVQKVIQLMQNMVDKGIKEKQAEQIQFAKFKQFCDGTTADKKQAIADAEEKIVVLKADIQKYTATAAKLEEEIAAHDEDIAVWTGDQKSATKVREIELTDYTALHKDYSESIDALERAIGVLKKVSADKKQAAEMLIQVTEGNLISKEEKRILNSFFKSDTEEADAESLAVSAPQANAYEFQSQGVVDMLQKLLDKFDKERETIEKEEVNAKHAYDMLMQDLGNSIDDATQQREDKSKAKAKALQAAADAKTDLEDTTTTMQDDQKYLSDLTATCEQKALAFADRQKLRAEEIEAVKKAMEIIEGQAVKGNSEKHLPQLVQTKVAAFAQLRSSTVNPNQLRVAKYLKDQAKKLDSRLLSALAIRVEADPFKKVKKMIKDLIVKLLEEANEEATHKGWCDKELATNEKTRNKHTETVEILHAEIDQLEASIAQLSEEITELTAAVAAINEAIAKATGIREAEKAKNTETISDAKEAQEAVAQALQVLKEFYAKAAEATAFLQTHKGQPLPAEYSDVEGLVLLQTDHTAGKKVIPSSYAAVEALAADTGLIQQQPEAPEIFDEPYKGMGGESGGVVAMLEVIQSDFARLEAETSQNEETAQKEYDQFMDDSNIDKAQKEKDIEHKTAAKQDQEQALTEKKSDLEGTQKELDAALDYYEKLKPDCVDEAVSYEDRVARRKEEIISLQDALKILNDSPVR